MFIGILNPLYDRLSYINIAMITYSSPWKPSHDAAPEIRMQSNLIFFSWIRFINKSCMIRLYISIAMS